MISRINAINFLYTYIMVITISILSYLMYLFQIQGTNEYMGMQYINILRLENISIFIFLSFLVTILLPKDNIKPSSIFIGIYLIFVIMWNISLFSVAGKLDYIETIFKIYILIFPVIFLYIIKYFIYNDFLYKILFPYINAKKFNIIALILILVTAGILGYFVMGGGSFDFNSSYVRRMAGRENFGTGTLYSYLFAMSLNGIAPILAFIGLYRRNIYLVVISLFFSIFAFWLIGTKAPMFYVVLMGILGYLVSINREKNILSFFLLALLFINILSLLEYLIFDFSIIADIFTRRAIAVVTQNQSYFIDFFFQHNSISDFLFGTHQDKPITFVIGELYYDSQTANINTNTFLYTLLQKGFYGYLISIVVISLFFLLLDVFYEKYKIKEILAIAIMYSLLLCEQAYTTAFISSGIALIFILLVLFRRTNHINIGKEQCLVK